MRWYVWFFSAPILALILTPFVVAIIMGSVK